MRGKYRKGGLEYLEWLVNIGERSEAETPTLGMEVYIRGSRRVPNQTDMRVK